MIKVVAIDLDGTMYNSNKVITQAVRNSILRLKETGVQPVIITGRGILGSELAIDQLGFDLPYICSAGALIKNGKGGTILHHWPFHSPKETALIIDYAIENDVALLGEQVHGSMIWFGSVGRFNATDPKTIKEIELGKISKDPFTDFDVPLLKLTVNAEDELQKRTSAFIAQNCPSLFHVVSSVCYMDVTSAGINKGTGLQAFAEHFGYSASEVAAIGDQEIDLHMLNYAGLPIAMGNAVESVKQASKLQAPSNNQNGVAWALNKIIEMNKTEYVN